MTRLSVNINKIALLRNARGGNNPDILKVAADCERFGADGITVHPRPDQRHIRFKDVSDLKGIVTTELNVEGYPDEKFIELIKNVRPHQVTLVPDPPNALTSNSGWDTNKHKIFLNEIVSELKKAGARVSIFLNPEPYLVESAAATGCDRIELYTERYAQNYFGTREECTRPYIETALEAQKNNLGLNAGHDLNLDNLKYFAQNIPGLLEVSIGHALVCDALYFGLENTIQMYKRQLVNSGQWTVDRC
jgi:pyridoxine 5-phosphate synthase